MSTTQRLLDCDVDDAWAVLADGWLYPLFVVGAARMREVDDEWPRVGAQLHHSVGNWPLLVDDTTQVLESRPPSYLRLVARAWPSGEAEVVFELEQEGPGRTRVTLHEDLVTGPTTLVPRPLRQPILQWRNKETLHRFALLAENRARPPAR